MPKVEFKSPPKAAEASNSPKKVKKKVEEKKPEAPVQKPDRKKYIVEVEDPEQDPGRVNELIEK